MAESEVTSESGLGTALYAKFPGPQVELSVDQDISSPDKSAADSSDCAMNSDAPLDELPNNNISGLLDRTQTANKLCDGETRRSDSMAAQYRLDKKLIVKLEAPTAVFASKLNVSVSKVDSSEEMEAEDNVSMNTLSDGGNVSDVSNGVVKKKRRSRGNQGGDGGSRSRQRSGSGRGRPPKKTRENTIATYHSQISGDKNTIKIRIRKSHLGGTPVIYIFQLEIILLL